MLTLPQVGKKQNVITVREQATESSRTLRREKLIRMCTRRNRLGCGQSPNSALPKHVYGVKKFP